MSDHQAASAAPGPVRSFVLRFRSEILAEWKRRARSIPVATDLPSIALADHIPDLLDQVAEIAERFADDTTSPADVETARRHAVARLGAGFDVAAVMHELSMLRGCALSVWDREHQGKSEAELRALNLAFDRAMSASVTRYVEARDRTLAAIDTISTASLEATSLDDLLRRLLAVFMGTTESVQSCAILLRDGDRLRTRVTVGNDPDRHEELARQMRAEGQPLEVREGDSAIYAVPLVYEGDVIGVAHMGSHTARQFADEDRHLFASMVARATVGIHHHLLRERLAESEERQHEALAELGALLAAAPVGIAFIDRRMRYQRVNAALASLNGKPVGEHLGRTIRDVLPADAGPRVEAMMTHILSTGEAITNLEARMSDERAFLASFFPVRTGGDEVTGVGAVVVDVTETRRTEAALATIQARLQAIIDHSPVAIYVKDAEGRIVLTNERTAQALGHTREELLGHRADELIPAEYARAHRANDLEVMRTGKMVEAEEVVPDGAGTRTFLTVKFPIPGDQGQTFVCGISTEITDRKHVEEELRVAIRARDEVLAVVSHDLRNPLSTIQLSASVVQSLTDDQRVRKHLDMIQRSSARMEHLISDLLDAARIEAKHFVLDRRPERADEITAEAVELQKPLAGEKGVHLHRVIDDDCDVVCDRARILQVFGNLIGNAIKFCTPGDTVTVACAPAGDQVRFSVSDTGPGLSEEAKQHLFEPYWSSPEHAARGNGLGLYIARGIVEAHGGHIEVESRVGDGATFAFTIPRR